MKVSRYSLLGCIYVFRTIAVKSEWFDGWRRRCGVELPCVVPVCPPDVCRRVSLSPREL